MKLYYFTLIFFSGQLLAEEVSSTIPSVYPVSSGYLLKLTLGLVFIVLLIFALAWLMKKMQLTQHSQNGLIHIVAAISVGHRDRIALIQVGDEQILVGLTPGRMQKLHTLKSYVNPNVNPKSDKPASQHSFTEKFKQLVDRDKTYAR